MTILQLLNQTVTGEALKLIQKWKKLQDAGWFFSRLEKLNVFLDNISEEQLNILKKKFKGTSNFYTVHDYLAEIVVAEKYNKDEPVFLPESKQKTPDIYLKKKNEYVEVKVIQSSDSYKEWEEMMTQVKSDLGTALPKTKDDALKEGLPFLTRDAKCKIARGIEQLKGKDGFIHLLYYISDPFDIDKNGRRALLFGRDSNENYFDLKEFLGQELEKWVRKYALEKNIKVVCEKIIYTHHERSFNKT